MSGITAERARSPFGPVGGWRRADLVVPLVVFVLLVAVKLVFVTGPTVGTSVDDERLYWSFAGELSRGVVYDDPKYPPLYPAAIAPAFHLPGDPYRTALALNALYSSLLVFPVWAISRLVMGVVPGTAVILLQALLPYHYIMPRILFSENVYFPLFATVLFMVLWRPVRRPLVWDAVTGVMLAALYLTRYVSLPIIPALLVVWWMREWQSAGSWRLDSSRWGRFVLMLSFTGAAFLPWVLLHRAEGTPAMLALGFGIASRAVPEQLTLDRLWVYVRMYLAYYALLAAPLLGLLFLSVREALRERALTTYVRLVAGVGVVSLGMLAALSRHSWRVHYNWPDPTRIMGRYTIYLAAFFLVVAFATFVRLIDRSREGTTRGEGHLRGEGLTRSLWPILLGVVLPALVLVASYAAVLGDAVMPFAESSITDRGSVDAYRIRLMGGWFWPLALGCIAAVPVLAAGSRRLGRSGATLVLAAAVALYSLVGVPTYFGRMEQHQAGARMAREMMAAYDAAGLDRAAVLISAEAYEVSGMVPATTTMTFMTFLEGRELSYKVEGERASFPPELGRSEDPAVDDAFDHLIVPVGYGVPAPEGAQVVSTWEHRGVAYALLRR